MHISKKFIIQIVIGIIEWNWFDKVSFGYVLATEFYIGNSSEYYEEIEENFTIPFGKTIGKSAKIKRSTGIVSKEDEFRYFNVGILMASHLGEYDRKRRF